MKKIFFLVLFVLTTTISFGQKVFTILNSSKIYNAKIQVEKCEDEVCSGKGTVKLYTKDNLKLMQEFKTEDLNFRLDNNKKLTDEASPLIFDDFNFDGTEDLAIVNGSGGYNFPSYDVYVFNISKKQFVISKELTELASFQGMFTLDKKRKRIIAYSKSGCCWHETIEYAVIPKKGLVKVYNLVEDATKGDDYVYVTERKLLNGKWTKATKKHKTKDYYKD